MTDTAPIQRPTPVAWKMLPFALLVLGLGFAGSGFIWQRTEMTYLAMDHSEPRSSQAEDMHLANVEALAAKSVEDTGANANAILTMAPVLPGESQQSLESAGLDNQQTRSYGNVIQDHEQEMREPSIAVASNTTPMPKESETSNNSGPSSGPNSGPDLAADILAQLSAAMVESDFAAEPLPIPLKPDDTQVEQHATDQYTDESENDFIILTLEESPAKPAADASQVPMFVGEKVQISREMVDAVDSGVLQRVITLIDQGESIDAVNSLGESALLKAAWNGDTELAEKLLERGADLSMAADDGRTPLFSAAVSGNLKLVQLMLELGADVNTSTLNGKTPLMVSAWSDYPEMTHLLLRFGADPDKIDNNGRNAIFYALWDRNIEVVKALLESGADLALIDKQGHSTMDIARLRRIILPGMEIESSLQN